MEYKLCYYDGKFLWFSMRDPKTIFGDDWNDAPYEYNASPPYEKYGPFKKIAFDNIDLRSPSDGFSNSPYSAEQINSTGIPWLITSSYADKKFGLAPGTTYEECIKQLLSGGAEVYVMLES